MWHTVMHAFVSFAALHIVLSQEYLSVYIHLKACHDSVMLLSSVDGRSSGFCSCSGLIPESILIAV